MRFLHPQAVYYHLIDKNTKMDKLTTIDQRCSLFT